jgi:hypothetical protein
MSFDGMTELPNWTKFTEFFMGRQKAFLDGINRIGFLGRCAGCLVRIRTIRRFYRGGTIQAMSLDFGSGGLIEKSNHAAHLRSR